MGMSEKNAQARQQNKARIAQFKQQMLIRDVKDSQRFDRYNLQKTEYDRSLETLNRKFGSEDKAQQLRMAELLKGSKLASQNELINQVEAVGKIQGRGVAGRSSAKMRQSALAKIGRATAARKAQLEGQQQAFDMQSEARLQTLDTARRNAFAKVQYAPQQSVQSIAPSMVEGANAFDMISGIGNAALGAATSFIDQSNFRNQLLMNNPSKVPVQ